MNENLISSFSKAYSSTSKIHASRLFKGITSAPIYSHSVVLAQIAFQTSVVTVGVILLIFVPILRKIVNTCKVN